MPSDNIAKTSDLHEKDESSSVRMLIDVLWSNISSAFSGLTSLFPTVSPSAYTEEQSVVVVSSDGEMPQSRRHGAKKRKHEASLSGSRSPSVHRAGKKPRLSPSLTTAQEPKIKSSTRHRRSGSQERELRSRSSNRRDRDVSRKKSRSFSPSERLRYLSPDRIAADKDGHLIYSPKDIMKRRLNLLTNFGFLQRCYKEWLFT